MTVTYADKVFACQRWIYSRETWLQQHSHKDKWPEHDLEQKRRDLDILRSMQVDFERAVSRDERKQA